MKLTYWLLVVLLCMSPLTAKAQQAPQRQPQQSHQRAAVYLPAGNYFELTPCVRCYRCAPCVLPNGWQRQIVADLRKEGIKTWLVSMAAANECETKGARRLNRTQGYNTTVFVGPYKSEQAARQAFKHLCEVASDFDTCRDWPEKEYSIGFADGVWAMLTRVATPPGK
jgi:hypothetical protein